MTIVSASLFVLAILLQILMISLLPQTRGYTSLWPTVACIVVINTAILCLARLAHAGVNLSVLIPLSAAVVPLGAIAVGIFIYGEPAPVVKIVLLCGACGLIGVASALR